MASPFETALGLYQGRIRPTGWTPEQGDYVYCLGHDLAGQTARISFGDDAVQIEQSVDVTGAKLVRFVIHERGPAAIPDGQGWTLETLLDGSVVVTLPLAEGRERTRRDLALDVSQLTGDHDIAVLLRAAGSDVAEAELPGIYVDAWQLTTSEAQRPTIFNRDPEPGDLEVPLDGAIAFDLADLDGVGVASAFDVYVDGEIAIAGGVLQAPWDGASAITPLDFGFRVGLVPATSWESQSVHAVRVQASTTDGAQVDLTWTFTAKDISPPRVVSAFAPAHTQVRVTFDEALGAGAATAANYTLALVSGAPAVTPEVVSATVEATGVVLLTLDIPQTPRAVYSVTAAAVEDAHGNAIAAPYNVAQWTGYECPKPAGRSLDLYAMWPRAYREQDTGDLAGFIAIFQEIVDLILCELDRYHERVLDPDTADEVYVDQMLRDLGNPFSIALSLTDKRRLLRVLVPLLRRRGTETGIEDAIRTLLGIDVTVVPVVPVDGPGLGVVTMSGSFVLITGSLGLRLAYDIVSPVLLTEAQRTQIRRIAGVMRRGVCHLRLIVEPGGSLPEAVPGLGSAKLSVSWDLA